MAHMDHRGIERPGLYMSSSVAQRFWVAIVALATGGVGTHFMEQISRGTPPDPQFVTTQAFHEHEKHDEDQYVTKQELEAYLNGFQAQLNGISNNVNMLLNRSIAPAGRPPLEMRGE